jgi:hypothetical protein
MPLYMPKGGWEGNFFGLDVVEFLFGLWKALLSVKHEFLHVSYRESSSDYSGLYLLVWRLYGRELADAIPLRNSIESHT